MKRFLVALFCLLALQAKADIWSVAAQVSNTGIVPTVDELKLFAQNGATVRDVLGWHRVEHTKGVFAMPPVFSQFYANVAAAGGKNIVTLGFGNKDAGYTPTNGSLPTTPDAIAGFTKYAVWVVKNVPSLYAVSIWNECNGSFCAGTVQQRQANYVALLKATVPAIRAANPNVKIIAGATVGWNVDGWFINIGKIYNWKLVDYLDLHPYVGDGPAPVEGAPSPLQAYQAQIKKIRAAGITNPAFYTEWGGPDAVKMGPPYMAWFKANVAGADPVAPAGGNYFTILATGKFPKQGLLDTSGSITDLGKAFIAARG